MKSLVPILSFFLVLAAIFSLSNSLSCHICDSNPECALQDSGRVTDCDTTSISNAQACGTIKTNKGLFKRICLDSTGLALCQKPDGPYKCQPCSVDACNNQTMV